MDLSMIISFLVVLVVAVIVIYKYTEDKKRVEELVERKANRTLEINPYRVQEAEIVNTAFAKTLKEVQKSVEAEETNNQYEAKRKEERLKIEQAKRQRQAEVTRKERQTHDSGITSPTSYETPYVASEPSYDSCSSSSSSSSYDSGSSSSSSSSSSDSGSSSYSSCD